MIESRHDNDFLRDFTELITLTLTHTRARTHTKVNIYSILISY